MVFLKGLSRTGNLMRASIVGLPVSLGKKFGASGDVVNVLIIYGTTEGQTRKIAEWTARHVRESGHVVELRDSAVLASGSGLETFDAFIIAASVHQACHQDTITNFATAHHKLLNTKPSAFISVSLSAVLEEGGREAQKYVDGFVSVTGWLPSMTLPSRRCFALYGITELTVGARETATAPGSRRRRLIPTSEARASNSGRR